MAFDVRPLLPAEATLYREIRLEALRLHPEAFGASSEHEAAQPLAFFEQRLTGNSIFAGTSGQRLLGVGGFMPETGVKRAHKGHLWGMYVRPEARGTGLARRIALAVLEHAAARVELIQLSVVAGNEVAHRLYLSLGFAPFGVEARALKVDGQYFDEIHMAKRLDRVD